VSWALDLVK